MEVARASERREQKPHHALLSTRSPVVVGADAGFGVFHDALSVVAPEYGREV